MTLYGDTEAELAYPLAYAKATTDVIRIER